MLLAFAGCLYVKGSPDKGEVLSTLGTPTEVAVRVANRRLTVAWREMPGATSYQIAIRPKDELVPTWREYTTRSSPYIADMWAMSGMMYEVRVAAVYAHGQSEWSDPIPITAPVLQAAPADAIDIVSPSPPLVGQSIAVSLSSQRPFANRSVWHWSICSPDGSGCKLLPRRPPYQYQPTWRYFMGPVMQGKRVSVQVDYDKEGVSYSATAVLGVVAAAEVPTPHLYDLQALVGTPAEVAVHVSNRRLTVAWREMPGATGYYKIAVRPKDELVPTWREYTAPSSPHTVDMWAMSGMEYEVRVAAVYAHGQSEWEWWSAVLGSPAVYAHGQSEWSAPAPITVPALQAAPADAIDIGGPSPPLVGQPMTVGLDSQLPVANQSVWHWSICNADGSGCKLLPRPQHPHQSESNWQYFLTSEMQGKRVSVQVDYDKDGVSYSATAVLGVVGAARVEELATHLYALDLNAAYLRRWYGTGWDDAKGGSSAPLSNDLLVATPWGKFALVRPNREVAYLDGNVPMNRAEFQAHPEIEHFRLDGFRVADILLKQHSAGRYELFVTHHYFTGECIRFRLSSTTLLQQGADVSVSPAWRTIFDAEPCLFAASEQAGGRMLTDGPDHLLVVIGDHLGDNYVNPLISQASDSHLGKLVRIEIETGRAETLASGLRNPQGLARDGHGTLWETEHGPRGGDELNVLEPGGNYGWPLVSYGVWYHNSVIGSNDEDAGSHDGFVEPVFAWVPSIGISNLVVNDQRWFPLWKDDLLIGSLSDHSLFRARRNGAAVQYVERIEVGDRIRDLAYMPDGRIALLSDGGKVYFLSRSYAYCNDENKLNRHIYAVDCADTVGVVAATGAQLYDTHCSGCHRLNAEEHGMGPHLVGVVGRRIGSVDDYLFSDALRSLDEVWTPTHLERFLANPKQFVPGTSKSSLHLTQAEARAIVDFIEGD